MSIPREHRLRKHAEFELVYRQGRRHFSKILTVFYLLREEDGAARVGITVGRALGKATVRNRIKRRVRAAVTQNLGRIKRAVDVVINPKKVVEEIGFQELCSEIAQAFDVIEQKATATREGEVKQRVERRIAARRDLR